MVKQPPSKDLRLLGLARAGLDQGAQGQLERRRPLPHGPVPEVSRQELGSVSLEGLEPLRAIGRLAAREHDLAVFPVCGIAVWPDSFEAAALRGNQ